MKGSDISKVLDGYSAKVINKLYFCLWAIWHKTNQARSTSAPFFRFAVICNAKNLVKLRHVCLACFHMPTVRKSWPSCARTRLAEKTSCDVTASWEASRGTRHLAGKKPRWCAAWRNRPAPLARWSQVGLRTNIAHDVEPRHDDAWEALGALEFAGQVVEESNGNSTCQITDEAMAQGKELAPLNCADGRLKANTRRIKSLIESWDPRLLLSL